MSDVIEATVHDNPHNIGDEVRFTFRLGNTRICGFVTAIGHDEVSGQTVRVTTRSPLMPTGWYGASFWKTNDTPLIED